MLETYFSKRKDASLHAVLLYSYMEIKNIVKRYMVGEFYSAMQQCQKEKSLSGHLFCFDLYQQRRRFFASSILITNINYNCSSMAAADLASGVMKNSAMLTSVSGESFAAG